jgi:hypothetical protein
MWANWACFWKDKKKAFLYGLDFRRSDVIPAEVLVFVGTGDVCESVKISHSGESVLIDQQTKRLKNIVRFLPGFQDYLIDIHRSFFLVDRDTAWQHDKISASYRADSCGAQIIPSPCVIREITGDPDKIIEIRDRYLPVLIDTSPEFLENQFSVAS